MFCFVFLLKKNSQLLSPYELFSPIIRLLLGCFSLFCIFLSSSFIILNSFPPCKVNQDKLSGFTPRKQRGFYSNINASLCILSPGVTLLSRDSLSVQKCSLYPVSSNSLFCSLFLPCKTVFVPEQILKNIIRNSNVATYIERTAK